MGLRGALAAAACVGVCTGATTAYTGYVAQGVGVGGSLNASGSTLLCPLMEDWTALYLSERNVTVNYDCIGSVLGKEALLRGEVDFAGTDVLFTEEQYAEYEDLQLIPMAVEAIVVTYYMPGEAELVLSRDAVGQIFSGEITRWNDPRITRWNPNVNMPNETIHVFVRDGRSGTTDLFQQALVSFGHWNTTRGAGPTWYADDELPNKNIDITRVKGQTALIEAVKRTPFSVGYAAATNVVQARGKSASIVNRAGTVSYGGRAGGTGNIKTMQLDPVRLTASIIDGLGYPIAGISYIAVRKFTEKACMAVKFAMWVLQGGAGLHRLGQSRQYRLFGEVATPFYPSQVGTVLERVLVRSCTVEQGAPAFLQPIDVEDDESSPLSTTLRAMGYYRYVHGDPDMALTFESAFGSDPEASVLPPLLVRDAYKADIPGTAAFPFALSTFEVVTNLRLTKGLERIRMEISWIKDLFSGRIAGWTNQTIIDENPFMYKNPYNVTIVAVAGLSKHNRILGALGIESSAPAPHVVLDTTQAVAQYVYDHPGAIAVLPPRIASAWGLVHVIPTIAGDPLVSDIDTVEGQLRSIAAEKGRMPNESAAYAQGIYPFYTVTSVVVPLELLPATGRDNISWDCHGALEHFYPMLEWMERDEHATLLLHNDGFASMHFILDAADAHPTGEGWGHSWEDLQCGGTHPFPPPPRDMTMEHVVAPTLSVFMAFVIVAVVVGVRGSRRAARIAAMTKHAPRAGEVAVVFTDIKKSSELWGKFPEEMTIALALHHKIIRACIERFEGYEVKTIGDAFMVAFTDPRNAVEFCMAIQLDLLSAEWPTRLLIHEACGVEVSALKEEVFKGLRVRAGCHYGAAGVNQTPVGGYDYDGSDINIAARVSDSGAGGQTLITEAVYRAIEGDLNDMFCETEVSYIGAFMYKGIAEPQTIYGIAPQQLACRVFEPMRGITEVSTGGGDAGAGTLSDEMSQEAGEEQRARAMTMQSIRKWVSRFGKKGVPPEELAVALNAGCRDMLMSETQVVVTVIKWALAQRAGEQDSRAGANSSRASNPARSSEASRSQVGAKSVKSQGAKTNTSGGGDAAKTSKSGSGKRSTVNPSVVYDVDALGCLRWSQVSAMLQSFPTASLTAIAELVGDADELYQRTKNFYQRIAEDSVRKKSFIASPPAPML